MARQAQVRSIRGHPPIGQDAMNEFSANLKSLFSGATRKTENSFLGGVLFERSN
jgi:hypothetical protein